MRTKLRGTISLKLGIRHSLRPPDSPVIKSKNRLSLVLPAFAFACRVFIASDVHLRIFVSISSDTSSPLGRRRARRMPGMPAGPR
ncbi:MAG: hypothetical protein WC483_05020 [Candidatus Paceibacterota bacterium]